MKLTGMGFYSCMVSVGQLEERLQQEGHQWELWQELKQHCSKPALWRLEQRIAAGDKKELLDAASGYRLRFVHDKPITLEVSLQKASIP